jgi:hypothetical protein
VEAVSSSPHCGVFESRGTAFIGETIVAVLLTTPRFALPSSVEEGNEGWCAKL